MYLKYVQIANYKNLVASKFEFSKGTNTVIGENDSGKSNAMTAIRILLDNTYFYNPKRLRETDFANTLDTWKGHWIIISAYFDEISKEDKSSEICSQLIPEKEDAEFLKSFIRCEGYDFGVVTLFIRPNKKVRQTLSSAKDINEFNLLRNNITLSDYEFYYTSRAQADFTDPEMYKKIVGDFEAGTYSNPDEDDAAILGGKVDILNVWQYISVVFIDALRDVDAELHKPKNPIRRVFDIIQKDIINSDKDNIKLKIRELNNTISSIDQISNIGRSVNGKLSEIVGLIYSPEIEVESRLKDDIESLARYLSVSPSGHEDMDFLGLGHLNILYIALKLVEFEYNRKHELLNIMIIEEPEAHIHTHIQKTLFDNLNVSKDYTQVIMTTHSTHLSEVSDISRVNIMKADSFKSTVMKPTNGLDDFGLKKLNLNGFALSDCLERYMDAKRSVLLFSKGVILVEGDGEEILIPAMVKKALGISLDELGLGIINIGSVSFEYIASIFDDMRLQRYCSIITDLDATVTGASKCSDKAAGLGISRRDKLAKLYGDNKWVECFYAPYTFEIDFANEKYNRSFLENIIRSHYIKQDTIDNHIANINSSIDKRYDSVLTMVKSIGKGWYATMLASTIDYNVIIPDYILKAIAHASQNVINDEIVKKMALYIIDAKKEDGDYSVIKSSFELANSNDEIEKCIDVFIEKFPDNNLSRFIIGRRGL